MMRGMPAYDYDSEAAQQQEIAENIRPEDRDDNVLSEDSVGGETADQPDAASIDTDDIVKVKLVDDADVNYIRIAGVRVEPGEAAEVTRATALLLDSHDKVEVVS
jgi:hypothetical protein